MPRHLPAVVLVGRPNVGKSTLFNRLSGTRRAIVTSMPGTTRDVIAQPAEWQGVHFELIDTGGMFGASQDPLHALVLERGRRAITSADLLVLVTDGREGLMPGDHEIAQVIRASNTPALLAINKADDKRSKAGMLEFYQLGFDQVFEIFRGAWVRHRRSPRGHRGAVGTFRGIAPGRRKEAISRRSGGGSGIHVGSTRRGGQSRSWAGRMRANPRS